MEIKIKDIEKKDYNKAIRFAVKGMNFDMYLNNRFLRSAYGRYFWYLEMNRATQILAAYQGEKLIGVLLAEMKGEEKKRQSFLQKLYVRAVNLIQSVFFQGGAGFYEDTAAAQLDHYLKSNTPDGEILFLAADPDCTIKGIGTMLLHELECREPGKTVYLFTDDACTYQFYEHRGFLRKEETEIVLKMPKGDVPLRCFLYSKNISKADEL